LLGDPFSFSPGAQNGKSTVTAVRVAFEWTESTAQQVLALRSRFSIGLDALGATIHESSDVPDGHFFSWLGQFQWARRLTSWDLQTIFRLDLQLTTDPLLPLEQIAVGGRFSVRGYRENQLVRDNGLIVAFESHLPLVRRKPWAHVLQLVPFVDFGKAWDHQGATPDPQMLVSVGIGLHWIVTLMSPLRWQPQLEVYWGYRLTDVETADDNLQDLGLHIRFVITAF
jgi:hemolysin activation/secretion protein